MSVLAHLKNIPYPTGHSEKSSITLFHGTCFFFFAQPSGISYFSLYIFSEVLASVFDHGLEFFVEVCLKLNIYIYHMTVKLFSEITHVIKII